MEFRVLMHYFWDASSFKSDLVGISLTSGLNSPLFKPCICFSLTSSKYLNSDLTSSQNGKQEPQSSIELSLKLFTYFCVHFDECFCIRFYERFYICFLCMYIRFREPLVCTAYVSSLEMSVCVSNMPPQRKHEHIGASELEKLHSTIRTSTQEDILD